MDAPNLHILADAVITQIQPIPAFVPRRSRRLQQKQPRTRLEVLVEVANFILQEEFNLPQPAVAGGGGPIAHNITAIGYGGPNTAEEAYNAPEELDDETMDRLAQEEITKLQQEQDLFLESQGRVTRKKKSGPVKDKCKICRKDAKGRSQAELRYSLRRHYRTHLKNKPVIFDPLRLSLG